MTSQAAFGKITPARSDMIGSFALQGTKGTSIAVISFSFWFSTVLAVMMPGTEHPVPTMKGMIDFPERPNFLNRASRKNAILDMYPVASKTERQTKSVISCGMKERTVEIPPMMPLANRSLAQTEPPAFSIAFPSNGPRPSISNGTSWKKISIVVAPLNSASMKSLVMLPTTPTERKYIRPMTRRKIGSARYLFSTILSSLSVVDSGIAFSIQQFCLSFVTY